MSLFISCRPTVHRFHHYLRSVPAPAGGFSPSELVAEFAAPCPACGAAGAAVTRIARLAGAVAGGSTVVAADACDACGWRGPAQSWDSGPEPEELGTGAERRRHFTLAVATPAQAAAPLPPIPRSSSVSIPELDLCLAPGSAAVAGAASPAALLAAVRADLGGPRAETSSDGDGGGDRGGYEEEWADFWTRFAAAESLAAPWSLVVAEDDGDGEEE